MATEKKPKASKFDKQLNRAEMKLMKAYVKSSKKEKKIVDKVTKQAGKAGVKLNVGPAPARRSLRQDGRWPSPTKK